MVNSDYIDIYEDFLKKSAVFKKPLTVVADSSNGTTGIVLKRLQNIPNLNLVLINDTPDPEFPAHGPNPLDTGATNDLSKKVLELKADLGVVFDADGDRAFFVDNKGETLLSHMVAVMLFKHNKPPYVADEMVYKSLEHMKIFTDKELFPSKIGTFYVKETLNKVKGTVGVEFSGHIFFDSFFGADSGIFTMIQVLNMLSNTDQTLTQFAATLPPQRLYNENPRLEGTTPAEEIPKIERLYKDRPGVTLAYRDGITIDFGDKWISIRGSNTEPVLRLIAGSKSDAESVALVHEISSLL